MCAANNGLEFYFSITAGFAAKGVQGPTIVNLDNLDEDRGVSFAMGGDPGAVTLATLMKYYQPNLHGASLGEHLVEASNFHWKFIL